MSPQSVSSDAVASVTPEQADALARSGLKLAASRVAAQMLENASAHVQRVQVLSEAIFAVAAERTKSGQSEQAKELMALCEEISKMARDDYQFALSHAEDRGTKGK